MISKITVPSIAARALNELIDVINTGGLPVAFNKSQYAQDLAQCKVSTIALASTGAFYDVTNTELRSQLQVEIYWVIFSTNSEQAAALSLAVEEALITKIYGNAELWQEVAAVEVQSCDQDVNTSNRSADALLSLSLTLRYPFLEQP